MLKMGFKTADGHIFIYLIQTDQDLKEMKESGYGATAKIDGSEFHEELAGVTVYLGYDKDERTAFNKLKKHVGHQRVLKLNPKLLDG